MDEEKEGVYVTGVLYSKEEMDLWQLDASSLEETNWGSRNDELEVVSRVSQDRLDSFSLFSARADPLIFRFDFQADVASRPLPSLKLHSTLTSSVSIPQRDSREARFSFDDEGRSS